MSNQINTNAMVNVLLTSLAAGLYDSMVEAGVGNYTGFTLDDNEGHEFLALFTLMPDGKTPMQMHTEAVEEINRLQNLLRKAFDQGWHKGLEYGLDEIGDLSGTEYCFDEFCKANGIEPTTKPIKET